MHKTTNLLPFQPKFGSIGRATFGMGCFWGPEAFFGQMPGVVRTRVGYSGGTKPQPTYREMGDHSETLQVDFDPARISYRQVITAFWDNHKPNNINGYKGRQYQSLLFFADEEQEEDIKLVLREMQESGRSLPDTEIVPFAQFHLAEERHQKYYLKRFPHAMDTLMPLFASHAEFNDSTIAARLNGLAKGYTSMERIMRDIEAWDVSPEERVRIIQLISGIRW